MNVLTLARTVRHLKPVQIYGRVWDRVAPTKARAGPTPPLRPQARPTSWPAARPVSLLAADRIRLLNRTAEIDDPGVWNDPGFAKLWLYNLHYFDDLNAPGSAARGAWHAQLIDRWMAENPPGTGVGWEPYPTSLRAVNWIKWILNGGQRSDRMVESLATQLRWLEARLEWRLLGNHLWANAKALVFGGLLFAGEDGDRWLATGLQIVRAQLQEQVLADGGHFERSPMYHAIVLEDLLDLINVGGSGDVVGEQTLAQWRAAASRMRAWLAAMSHPDGQIAFFNDAAFGIAAEPATLAAYARQLGLPPVDVPAAGVIRLDQSGYVRLSCSDAVALVDAAPIGPDYLPGHAHADTLSFELSLGAERIVVNGGTSRYGLGPERLRERGTAAHSTVELDGENSSEVWSGFRVGRRARIIDTRAWGADGVLYAEAAHDGYRHRPGRPVHRRRWALAPGQLEIADTVEGRASAAVARLHLGPGVRASAADDGLSGELITPGGRRVRWTSTSPAAVLTDVWSPEFGRQVETGMLEIAFGGSTLATSLRW